MGLGQRPNRRLRLQRLARGWSQDDVAAGLHRLAASIGEPQLGVDATMVSRWERGTRRPRPRYVRLLCRLFELPADQLGVVEEDDAERPAERAPDAVEDDLERRDFLSRMTALLGAAAVPLPRIEPADADPGLRLARALSRRPGPVDDELADHLERITVALEGLGPSVVSPNAILGPTIGHLDAIRLLLEGSLRPALRARLCSLAAETAGFAGWLHWDIDDPVGAASYFGMALGAAREADDPALVAYLTASAACQPPYRESPRRRLDQLQAVSWADTTPATRVWLAAKEADAHALLGDADGCSRALARAQHELAAATDDGAPRRPRFDAVDQAWLDGERGASLAKLGRTQEARAILVPVLNALGPAGERDWLWLAAALASTHVQDREPEEAARVAGAVLERAVRMGLGPVLELVRGMLGELGAHGPIPAVQELDERLRATLAG
ncbi:MAG TPA: helix-turn-helix transcriptional regulator [Candidatus Dormibacteraeota bacterium]|nr:helix-turn-helix transcriptional regulator [Candidatus Dormibacteraeota bacterium]